MIRDSLLKTLNYVLNVHLKNLILKFAYIAKNHINFIMIFKYAKYAQKHIINNVLTSTHHLKWVDFILKMIKIHKCKNYFLNHYVYNKLVMIVQQIENINKQCMKN